MEVALDRGAGAARSYRPVRLSGTENRRKAVQKSHAEVGFTPITLEAVIEALAEAGAADVARQLWFRYLDFPRVYDLALAADIPNVGFKRAAAQSSPARKQASSELPPGLISEVTLDDGRPVTTGADAEEG